MHAGLPEALSIQVVNLGGAIPMLIEQMDYIVRTREPGAAAPLAAARIPEADRAAVAEGTARRVLGLRA